MLSRTGLRPRARRVVALLPDGSRHELHHRQPEFDHRQYHHTWLDYLYWDSELEQG